MGNALHTTVVGDGDGFEGLREEWGRLLRRSTGASVFQSHDWLAAVWGHGPERPRPAIVAVWDDGQLVGLAPLGLSRTADGFRHLRYLGWGFSDYEDFLALPGRRREALEAIFDRVRRIEGWDRFHLSRVPTDSPNYPYLQELFARWDGRRLTAVAGVAPRIRLTEAWCQQWRRSDFLKKSRRQERQLAAEIGPARLVRPADEGEAGRLMERLTRLVRARYEGTRLGEAAVAAVYREAAQRAFRSGSLQLTELRAGEGTAAINFALRHDGCVYGILTSFDEKLRKYSPGRLLLIRLIDEAIAAGAQAFDLCLGEEGYKSHFRPEPREVVAMELYRPGWRGGAAYFWSGLARPALARQPLAQKLASRLRSGRAALTAAARK